MAITIKPKTFLLLPVLLVLVAGVVLTVVRFTYGLGKVTALSDAFPWGLWVGFDVVCGVALAAGGFILTAITYLFNAERYKPVLRPAILTAFLGYILVSVGLLYDLGKPWNIWHPLVMWNPHSVMFEVAWCVMLYSTVLALEFSSIIAEAMKWKKVVTAFHAIAVPLVLAGVLLSTLHQSSLGSLFLIVPLKLHPLWYSSLLPLNFFLSAVAVGFAMVILESFISSRILHRGLEFDLLVDLGRFLWFAEIVFLAVRLQDLFVSGVLHYAMDGSLEGIAFLIEMGLFFTSILLLSIRRIHNSKIGLFFAAATAVLGVMANRLNVSLVGMLSDSKSGYFPSWSEITISLFLVTMGVIVFFTAARYLPIFPPEKEADISK
ncbi:MAG: Ni/Fe-hydrogenase cytochrome b subunit [bacterium]|nr:Ni/Fe-hydrogenase cytochrome b subunit [bacterium]